LKAVLRFTCVQPTNDCFASLKTLFANIRK